MRFKKSVLTALVLIAAVTATFALAGCEYQTDRSNKWKTKFDISMPEIDGAGQSEETANADGWYATLIEEFDDGLGEYFLPEHRLRRVEYWCDKTVSVKDGKAVIAAFESDTHECESCPSSGLFTGGITTANVVDGKRVPVFQQAFGYFEATVKFPDSDGMWSAFWLQSESMGQIGNGGKDGSEIDIYESSFYYDRTKVGHCIHWDGYGKKHKAGQSVRDTGTDLYDGYHTFALKWTPNEYVFYVDGVANWATDFGGVSRVPAYLLLTNEIRPNTVGPYAQRLRDFGGGNFYIDSVRVYQNVNYLSEIRSPTDFS